jgi:hypothetical protein
VKQGRRKIGWFAAGTLSALALFGAATGAWAQMTPGSAPAPAPGRQDLTFVTHASFFSQETHRTPAIDPQVFVRDNAGLAGTGPQNIDHVAGIRPARLDDSSWNVAYNAHEESLEFTLAKWFGATGSAEIAPQGAGNRVTLAFEKLIPFGMYSVFRVTFSSDGTTFKPLDGDGTADSFTAGADGGGKIVIDTPTPLQHDEAIVLVYHSDSQNHGASRGTIGVTAHHQLIARLP